jgi:hypothetical protein
MMVTWPDADRFLDRIRLALSPELVYSNHAFLSTFLFPRPLAVWSPALTKAVPADNVPKERPIQGVSPKEVTIAATVARDRLGYLNDRFIRGSEDTTSPDD